jgi:hypothetical protein
MGIRSLRSANCVCKKNQRFLQKPSSRTFLKASCASQLCCSLMSFVSARGARDRHREVIRRALAGPVRQCATSVQYSTDCAGFSWCKHSVSVSSDGKRGVRTLLELLGESETCKKLQGSSKLRKITLLTNSILARPFRRHAAAYRPFE